MDNERFTEPMVLARRPEQPKSTGTADEILARLEASGVKVTRDSSHRTDERVMDEILDRLEAAGRKVVRARNATITIKPVVELLQPGE